MQPRHRRRLSAWGLVLCSGISFACEDLVRVVGRVDTEEASTGGSPSGGQGGGEPGHPSGGSAFGLGGGGASFLALDFEAEAGRLSSGLEIRQSDGITFVTSTVAAEQSDAPGSERARYDFTVDTPGEYVIWGHVHGPSVATNRFWFRVDAGTWYLWRVSTGSEWFWDDLHDNFEYGVPLYFQLDAGPHRLEVANAVTGAEVDAFSIRLATEDGPSNDVQCNPPHSVLIDGACVRSCGSYGNVSCGADVCAGLPEVVSYDCALCCLLD